MAQTAEAGIAIVTGDTKVKWYRASGDVVYQYRRDRRHPHGIRWGGRSRLARETGCWSAARLAIHGATILNLREQMGLGALSSDCAVLTP